MIELLEVGNIIEVFVVCFFIGFGLSLFGLLVATLFRLAKDILNFN